jgi:ribosomal protein S18 acetylase RimI-like enzyme
VCRAIHHHCRVLDRLFPSLGAFARDFALATPGGDVREHDGVSASIVPAMRDRSVVNCVVYDDAGSLRAGLGFLASTYDEAGIQAWTVWAHETDAAATDALAAAGNVLDAEPMGMGRELDGIDAPGPGELELVPDPSPGDVADILATVYHWDNVHGALVRWYDGYHPYLALADGRPAATLAIHDHDGDAHVTLVGTLEAARGRGLAKLLMRQALADARERGCTTTTLVATKMGHPVYARLGYRDLGRMQMWERRKPDAIPA